MSAIHLDIDMLRCFQAVAETGSFTRAGELIGLTQSGVSVKIRRLEERLDTPVFNRTGKVPTLTLEGEILMSYARRILSFHDEAVHRLSAPRIPGKLRVGLADYFLPNLLPNLLCRFRRHYPEIHLEVQTGVGMNLMPLYERGELDLVVAGQDAHDRAQRTLVREPLVWTAGREYEPPRDDPVALLPAPCRFRTVALEALEKAGRKWEITFTGTSVYSVLSAVQAGMGLSVMPAGALGPMVRELPLEFEFPELPMHALSLFTDPARNIPSRELFIDYLEMELARKSG